MPLIEVALWCSLLLSCWLASVGVRAAYRNGVTDGYGYAREPWNRGYQTAGGYLRKHMAYRWRELRDRAKVDEHCETCGKPVDDCECLPCNVCDWTLVTDVEAVCEDCRKMAAKDKPNDKSCHTD